MKILKKISYVFLAFAITINLFSCAKNTNNIKNNISESFATTKSEFSDNRLDVDKNIEINKNIENNIDTDKNIDNNINTDKNLKLDNITHIDEDGTYTSRDDVVLYIHTYKKLPSNFITKSEARKLGWQANGNNDLSKVAKGKSIGGDEFKNLEKLLPIVDGRKYYECDIDYVSGNRNAKRIVYAIDDDEDGNEELHIYYTDDHYNSFTEIIID